MYTSWHLYLFIYHTTGTWGSVKHTQRKFTSIVAVTRPRFSCSLNKTKLHTRLPFSCMDSLDYVSSNIPVAILSTTATSGYIVASICDYVLIMYTVIGV